MIKFILGLFDDAFNSRNYIALMTGQWLNNNLWYLSGIYKNY